MIRAGHPITITIVSKLTSAAVLFSPAFMEPPHEVLSVFDMSPLARELVRECKEWGPESGPLTPYATKIFEALAEVVLRLSQRPSHCVLPAPVSPMLKKAVQITEGRAHEDMSFNDLARLSHQSPRALARRFSEEMNMTWREVRRHFRIMNALDALATTGDPITQIALSVGYKSLSGFNAAFREQMQISPSAFRAGRLQ
ncbi:MAG: helix-turn-helix transcriptional regulator [Paracoccaceae bacterium]